MEKLDRLGWATGIAFDAYGLSIGIRVNESSMPEDIVEKLPLEWTRQESPIVRYLLSLRLGGPGTRPGVRNFYLLYAGASQVARTLDREVALQNLENALVTYVSAFSRKRIFVHAGVVAWQGKAVVLPGRSHAGKSTLVAELLKAGATYFSDEYALLDECGNVHPYARRLALRKPDGPERVSAATLGAATGNGPLPVAMVVRTEYRPGSEWRPQRLTPGKAMMELASHMLPEAVHSPEGQTALAQLVQRSPAYKGPRGEAEVAAREIIRTLENSL